MIALPDAKRNRPGVDSQAAPNVTDGDTSRIPRTTDDLAPLEAMSRTPRHPRAVAPGFVVFLMRRDRTGWRRQVYVSLAGANKAVDRAKANGLEVRVQLVELVPVPAAPLVVVDGGDAA